MADDEKIRWVLEMRDLAALKPQEMESPGIHFYESRIPWPQLNRFLHREVGTPWRWGGREDWGDKEWEALANDETVQTWIGYVKGTMAGYYEIQQQVDGSVRIITFGLREQFIGKGYGRYMLFHAVKTAFDLNPNRVWLSTCNYDHPNAMKNYLARGFRRIDHG